MEWVIRTPQHAQHATSFLGDWAATGNAGGIHKPESKRLGWNYQS